MEDTSSNLPVQYQSLYGPNEIAATVDKMGQEISLWAAEAWRSGHTDILTIPVLSGGIFFFTDLVRRISYSVEIAPARAWAYEETPHQQRVTLEVNIQHVPAKGRSVLLVDDICDSGRTLKVLSEMLLEAGALTVKSAVLVKRELGKQTFAPDWVGFHYQGPEWLVGYGMDNNDRWRNLPGIYVIRQSEQESAK